MSDRRKVLDLFEEQKDLVNEKVAYGIEHYRKGDARITVTDANGNPLPNAKVKVNQTSHEFRFGANIFMLDELETDEKNEKYKRYFSETFNMATLPFYWDSTEPEKGKLRYGKDSSNLYRRPPIDRCMEFCEKHGIEPREHGLAYDYFFPKWLWNASDDVVKSELERRYAEISERYADKIPTIEVTNEMIHHRGKTGFYDAPEFVEWCFRLAEKYFSKNQLVINEGRVYSWCENCRATDHYSAYIEANLLKGTRIDAIGMQYHLFHKREDEYEQTRQMLNPAELYGHMDLYARFGKPLQVTEVTIPAYSWEAEDEEMQAEMLEKLYSIWFSHPAVEQIVYWNLVDGYAHVWDPDPEKIRASQGDMTLGENYYYGGLLRYDMSPKPSYFKLKELLEKTWHTEEQTLTNENGVANFRGFYGKYDVEIEHNGEVRTARIDLSKTAENCFTLTI